MTQRHPLQSDVITFVTTNTRNWRPIFYDPAYAREAIEILYRVQELHPFLLYGFVIMPDHCHFLLETRTPTTVAKIMNRFKMGVSHSIGIGSIWHKRFFVRYPDDATAVLRYIHQNPVKAQLCEYAEEYPWSSGSGRWEITALEE